MTTIERLRQSAVPFEVVGLAGFFVASVLILAGGSFPPSLDATLPHTARLAWAAASAVGSGCALGGLFWRGAARDALTMEAVGTAVAGGACLLYASAIIVVQGASGIMPAGTIGAFGIACGWRALTLLALLRRAAIVSRP